MMKCPYPVALVLLCIWLIGCVRIHFHLTWLNLTTVPRARTLQVDLDSSATARGNYTRKLLSDIRIP